MKKILPLLYLLLLTIVVSPLLFEEEYLYPVFAKDATNSTTTLQTRKEKLDQKSDARLQKLENKKEKVLDRIEERKQRIATREAALKARLGKFKDKIKASRVEKINENLEKVNGRRTEQMLTSLEKMSAILTRLEDKISQAETELKDLSAAKSAIEDAKAKIAEAESAVESQKEKDYVIEVSTESKVKDDAMLKRDALHTDLKTVHNLVVEARKALANAISTTVSSLKGVSNGQ